MKQNRTTDVNSSETKVRIPVWLYPSTIKAMDQAMARANCKSRSEFIEKAVCFYAGYLSGDEAVEYLPAALVSALRATVQCSEDRISRLLFKLAVEMSMMMNVLAIGLEIDADQMDRLRGQCVQDVKRSNGGISFKDTVQERQM